MGLLHGAPAGRHPVKGHVNLYFADATLGIWPRACQLRGRRTLWRAVVSDDAALLTARSAALDLARRIVEAVRITYAVHRVAHERAVSIGITYPSSSALPNADEEEVLKEADEAMYRAKREGKNRFEVFART